MEEVLKENERLKLERRKMEKEKARKKKLKEPVVEEFKVDTSIKTIYSTLKKKGLPLAGMFRMANQGYKDEILNEDLVRTFFKVKVHLAEKDIMKLVNAIDTSANGKIS